MRAHGVTTGAARSAAVPVWRPAFPYCLGLAYFLARRDTIRAGERWEWD